MRTNKKLAIENLERREVFSVASGFEGLAPNTQVTDQEIIDALNAGTQFSDQHRVDSPRDAASGMASENRMDVINAQVAGFKIQIGTSDLQNAENLTSRSAAHDLEAASVDQLMMLQGAGGLIGP